MKLEQVKTKEIDVVEEVSDLPVSDEQADETKGGELQMSKASPKIFLAVCDGDH